LVSDRGDGYSFLFRLVPHFEVKNIFLFPLGSVYEMDAHCKEDWNYVFPEIKLRGPVPNFHIHMSVSDLYISRIGPPILLQPNRQTYRGNK
jgi:hypothetical protein